MSAASESFSALDHIENGDWDRYLLRLGAAIRLRMRTPEYQAHIVVGVQEGGSGG